MTQRSQAEVERALSKKGFREVQSKHRRFVYHWISGKKSAVHTKTSHGSSASLGSYLLGKMAKQCHLSKTDFLNLVDCPMTREDYESVLAEQGITAS